LSIADCKCGTIENYIACQNRKAPHAYDRPTGRRQFTEKPEYPARLRPFWQAKSNTGGQAKIWSRMRRYRLTITPAGIKARDKGAEAVNRIFGAALNRLSAADQATLSRIVDQLQLGTSKTKQGNT
jgi:hypothetical protein